MKQELENRLSKAVVRDIARRVAESAEGMERLFECACSDDERVSYNALWCLTCVQPVRKTWLRSKQNELIDMLLVERHAGKKRLLLHMLRNQDYTPDTVRSDFLDYCLGKINSENEPYAVRAFCIHCAYAMSRFFPELIAELEEHLAMMTAQTLSPGLRSALRATRKSIEKQTKRNDEYRGF